MKHELAIEAIQDRIIKLTGHIEVTKNEDIQEISKNVVIKSWNKEIEQLKESQQYLINHQ